MCDANRMIQDDGVDIGGLIDIDTPHQLKDFSGLGALMRALGVDCFANQMECREIIPHFRCV